MQFLRKDFSNRIIIGIIYASIFLSAALAKEIFFLIILLGFFLITSLFEFYNITRKTNNILIEFLLPIIYILIPISCIFLIKFQFENNLLAYLLTLTWISDTSAFIIGKLFGKIKLSNTSPNKTIEGLIGSLVICTLTGPFIITYLNIELKTNVYLLSFFISASGNFGDYLESRLKRKFNQKDSGTILMSHGGILDRIDSLLISSPLFYYILNRTLN